MIKFLVKTSVFAILMALVMTVNCHSWVEQVSLVEDVAFQNPGYPRGNGDSQASLSDVYPANYSVVIRTSPEFLHNGTIMTYLLPPNGRSGDIEIISSDRICMPSQQFPYQSQGSPRLKVRAGKEVVLRYQENGHVTLPHATPGKATSGTVFVYGTKESRSTDTLLNIHKVWDKDGTAGDARGRLLAEFDFDDGECYGPNFLSPIYQLRQKIFEADPGQGPNRWCRNRVQVPKETTEGLYTLYWVWDWPSSLDTPDGSMRRKDEIYTTCLDLHVVT